MKYILTIAAGMLFLLQISNAQNSLNAKADAIISKMTLDEKVGQMTEVTLAVIAKGGWGNQDGSLDPAAVKKAIQDYKVGSVLNTTSHALPAEQWRNIITQLQDEEKKTRLNIPVIYGLDGIHGQTYTLQSTLFPPKNCAHREYGGIMRRYWIVAVNLCGQGFPKPMVKMYILEQSWAVQP